MGPGCPVCITPGNEIDLFIETSLTEGVTVATYGDLLRVPGSRGCLMDYGGSYKVVQSASQAVHLAERSDDEVVFLSIGFETTAPTTAAVILDNPPRNFSIISSHRVIPPAIGYLLGSDEVRIHGLLLPGHVSTIIGSKVYEQFLVPQAISGFEPADVLMGVDALVDQIASGICRVDNTYKRAVRPEGNTVALALMDKVFEVRDSLWRGFPVIRDSGLGLKEEYGEYDAVEKLGLRMPEEKKATKGCICEKILLGVRSPEDCKLFAKKCTPYSPVGPCMVSREGACRIWHQYR